MAAARFGHSLFGHYRLERALGSGGMGQVWAADDTRDGRRVALKLLPAELAADEGYRARFEREAVLAAALRDPHIPAINAHGAVDGRLFIDMELVEGADLSARLAEHGPLDPHTALDILAQIAAALDAAHAAGLVHRDVKPANILVRPDGWAYLIDFGIARTLGQTSVTATGLTIGTWAYMAPERFTGHADARSDIYSLACVLFETLTGRRPYGDTEPAQQMHGHLMTDAPRASAANPAVPPALDEVIALGMAKDPAARPASAGAFVRAAHAALACGPAKPATARYPVAAGPADAGAPRSPGDARPVVGARSAGEATLAGGSRRWVPPAAAQQSWWVRPSPRPRPPAPREPRARQWAPRKRRGGLVRTVMWATLLLVLAPCLFGVGCLAVMATNASESGSEQQDGPPPAAVEEPAPGGGDTVAPAGTPVRDGKFEFRVAGLDYGERVGFQSARGEFLIVTLAVRNHSDETKWFLPFGQKLVLTDGSRIDHDATATAWQAVQDRQGHTFELTPGAEGTAVLVFDVPDAVSAAHLELHDFVLSDGVSVALY